MNRILIAWELGTNYGHLLRQLPIALKLRRQGHELLFAVRDMSVAARILGPHGFAFVQAPFAAQARRMPLPPANFAELLIAEGYAEPGMLATLATRWLSLMEDAKVELMIVEHAPTARFAAYLCGLPAILVGGGFEIPPDCSPLPSIRPWEPIAEGRLLQAEACVMDRLNATAADFGAPYLCRLPELFRGEGRVIATFAELDPYGMRKDDIHAGSIYSNNCGQAINWQHPDLKHVVAYLRPGVSGYQALLHELSRLPAEVVLVAPGIPPDQMQILSSSRFRLFSETVSLQGLLESTDLAVTYGGIGMVSQCLLAGIPLLLAPEFVEQYLMGRCVEKLGAGLCLGQKRREQDFSVSLVSLLSNSCYRKAAQAFAKKYADYQPEQAIDQVVRLVGQVLNG